MRRHGAILIDCMGVSGALFVGAAAALSRAVEVEPVVPNVVPWPQAPGPRTASRSRWALPVLLSAVLVTTLDFFVVNAALPAIERDLGASTTALRFVVSGYGLAYASTLITAARLGELYGQRRVFTIGVASFTIASAGCGLAADAPQLVGFRVAQGAAAALMAPQVLVLIGSLYPGGPERARAFGRYGATVGLAGVGGQVVGGLLIVADPAGLGWRTCFLVNLPLGVAALALTARSIAVRGPVDPVGPTRPSLDVVGTLVLSAGLTAAAWPFLCGGEEELVGGREVLCVLLASALLIGFLGHQRRRLRAGRRPLLDPALFRERGFAPGLAALALLFGTSAALSLVLPLYLQLGCGLGPLASGAVAAALNLGFLGAAACAGRLYGRFGDRLPSAGALLLATGVAVAACGSAVGTIVVPACGLLLAGAGMGLVLAPLTSAVLAGVAPTRVAAASGVLGTFQEMGGVLGGAIVGSVFFDLLGPRTTSPAAGSPVWDTAFRGSAAVLVLSSLAIAVLAACYSRRRRRRCAAAVRAAGAARARPPLAASAATPDPDGPRGSGGVALPGPRQPLAEALHRRHGIDAQVEERRVRRETGESGGQGCPILGAGPLPHGHDVDGGNAGDETPSAHPRGEGVALVPACDGGADRDQATRR